MLLWFRRLLQGLFGKAGDTEEVESSTVYQTAPTALPVSTGVAPQLPLTIGPSQSTPANLHANSGTDWVKTWSAPEATETDAFGVASRYADDEAGDVQRRYVYALRDDFLSFAEASFFRVLRLSITESLLVFPKVRLADLVYAPKQDTQYGAWQKINRKHVDFVLCDAASLRPRLVIELDDRSHRRAERIERDEFVDGIFGAVGLPILRVPVGYAYSTIELAALIDDAVQGSEQRDTGAKAPVLSSGMDAQAPTCRRCGGKMVLRTAAQGKRSGEKFWGCVNYPRCRAIVPLATTPLAITGD